MVEPLPLVQVKLEKAVEVPLTKREYNAREIFSHRLRTASLEDLVVKVILDRDEDSDFINCFLTSYRVVCTPEKLLQLFLDLFKSPRIKIKARETAADTKQELLEQILKHQKPAAIDTDNTENINLSLVVRTNIAFTIKRWLAQFFDFHDDTELFETLLVFVRAQENKKRRHTQPIEIIQEGIEAFRSSSELYKRRLAYPIAQALKPQSVLPILGGKLSPEYIAQQLTMLEYELTRNVRPRDLLSQDQTVSSFSPLHTYANHFKNVRQFFVAEILSQPSYKGISLAIKRAISIAQHCETYHNYNTLMEIISALCTPDVICNEKAWDSVDSKIITIFEELSNKLCSDDNYAAYHKVLKSTPNPCVPFLGVHVGDIRFIDDFNQTEIVDMINVDKLILLAKEIHKLQSIQGSEYKFPVNAEFRERFIENFCHIGELHATFPEHSSTTTPVRLKTLRDRYENYYSDSNILGQDEFNLALAQLGPRDWSVITSSAKRKTFTTDEIIFEQETNQKNTQIAFLKAGKASFKRSELILRSVSAPAIIGAQVILNSVDNGFQVISESECVVEFVEIRFLVSLLESDSHLALRFFTELSFELIKHLHQETAVRMDSERSVRLRRSARATSPANPKGEPRNIAQRLVVKPVSTKSNPSLCVDPKLRRERQFRKLFKFADEEVLIKEYKASLFSKTINSPGTLFISQKHVCFYVKLFNHKSKMALSYNEILNITKKKNKICIETSAKKRKLIIRLKEPDDEDAFALLENILSSIDPQAPLPRQKLCSNLESQSSSLEKWRENPSASNSLGLTPEDWKLILGGAKRLVARKGTTLVSQNSNFQRIFQIIRGTCRIERLIETPSGQKPYIVGTIAPTEIFGEISFVQRKGATANVIVDSDELEVFIIEGYYIRRLLQLRPELAGRFLHYICCILQRRLNQNDRFESQEERKVVNLIAEPLHHNIPKYPVLPASLGDPILFEGPHDVEEKELEIRESTATPFCCATSISTYPIVPIPSNDPESLPQFERQGSPICDQYRCLLYSSRMIVGVADGCNWGEPPRNAARAAINAFTRYLASHQAEIGDLQYAGGLVLRALSMANAEIFKGIDTEKSMIGTTTLLGGIILELDVCIDMGSSVDVTSAPDYGFVYVSIGDCKAFHWSCKTRRFTDITASNRAGTLSASDCGGRLGPYEDNLPDLRNLELGFFPCHTGDYIMIVSDGVHDNLDPSHLGFLPRDLGIKADDWKKVPNFEEAEEVKNRYRISLLKKIIFGDLDSAVRKRTYSAPEPSVVEGNIPSPLEIVSSLTSYCAETCNAAASWMAANPKGRLPKDYRLYPGKMDHTTCVCVRVGELSQ